MKIKTVFKHLKYSGIVLLDKRIHDPFDPCMNVDLSCHSDLDLRHPELRSVIRASVV